jgi:hypothetical protein
MIVVRVELHSAIDGHIEELGQIVIANDDTGTNLHGNYWTRAYAPGTNLYKSGLGSGVINNGTIRKYRRTKPIWSLVAKALKAMEYK